MPFPLDALALLARALPLAAILTMIKESGEPGKPSIILDIEAVWLNGPMHTFGP